MADHTNEQLRRAIAELDGVRIEIALDKDPDVYNVYHKENYLGATFGDTIEEAWECALSVDGGVFSDCGARLVGIPDWPGDLGDAMTLCLEIALANNWSVSVTPYSNDTFVAEFDHARSEEHIAHAISETDALSLANVAYAALKVQAVSA